MARSIRGNGGLVKKELLTTLFVMTMAGCKVEDDQAIKPEMAPEPPAPQIVPNIEATGTPQSNLKEKQTDFEVTASHTPVYVPLRSQE